MAVRAIQAIVLIVVSSAAVDAQRAYNMGATVDFTAGVESDSRFLGTTKTRYDPSFALYPAITVQSSGPRSTLNFGYAFGWNRVNTEQKHEYQSHSGFVNFSKRFSPRWSALLSDSFTVSNDVQTFYALRGVLPTPEGLQYYFYPVVTNQLTTTNGVSGSVEHSLSQRSRLTFGGTYSLRHYPLSTTPGLSNQRDWSGNASYSRDINEHNSWNVQYAMSTYNFNDYSDARMHSVRFGMTTELAQKTAFSWSAGLSRTYSPDLSSRYGSYETSASLNREIKRNMLQISFAHTTAPNGLGSLAKNRTLNAGWNREIGHVATAFASVNLFDGIGVVDNDFATRGGSANANIGFKVGRKMSIQVGGHYQRYTRPVIYRFTQKGFFVSLRYSEPRLWRSY